MASERISQHRKVLRETLLVRLRCSVSLVVRRVIDDDAVPPIGRLLEKAGKALIQHLSAIAANDDKPQTRQRSRFIWQEATHRHQRYHVALSRCYSEAASLSPAAKCIVWVIAESTQRTFSAVVTNPGRTLTPSQRRAPLSGLNPAQTIPRDADRLKEVAQEWTHGLSWN